MQLRKLLRILNKIKEDHGDRISVTIQAKDYQGTPYHFHNVDSAGISSCFMEDDDGWLKDNETRVVSLGLELPNVKEYK